MTNDHQAALDLIAGDEFVRWRGGKAITLDGGFTVQQLRAIVEYMEEHRDEDQHQIQVEQSRR